MHEPEPVLENETQKLPLDIDIQTDHLIAVRRPDLIIISTQKRTYIIVDFAVPTDNRVKLKESEKKDMLQDLARQLKKSVEHENDLEIREPEEIFQTTAL